MCVHPFQCECRHVLVKVRGQPRVLTITCRLVWKRISLLFTLCARLAGWLPSSESRVSATHLAVGVPGWCYGIQWYMGSGDSDSTPTVKQMFSPQAPSSGLYSFLEALGKTFSSLAHIYGENWAPMGIWLGFPFPFLLRVVPSFQRLCTCFWLMALSIIFR